MTDADDVAEQLRVLHEIVHGIAEQLSRMFGPSGLDFVLVVYDRRVGHQVVTGTQDRRIGIRVLREAAAKMAEKQASEDADNGVQ